jgi:TRAP-type uncharacterized transport system substrate-binding protein
VVNRFRTSPKRPGETVTHADVEAALAGNGLTLEDDAPTRLLKALTDAESLAALDARNVQALTAVEGVPVLRVRELASDVHDLELLSELAEMLMNGGI